MPEIDRSAVRRATAGAAVAVALVVISQGAIAAVVTTGQQPLGTTERVPALADSGQWSDAEARTVSLSDQKMALPYGGGSVDEVEVRALTNDSHVAVRLTWEDPTNDTSLAAPNDYADAAAVMLRTGEKPPITMGAAGTPVDIWYWRAQWQYGTGEDGEWAGDMYGYPHPDEETKPGQAAGNPLSQARYETYGQNYYASGFGSLSYAPAQNVRARGVRDGDEWSVVFVREHVTNGTHDAAFRQNETTYLTFAVWNGSAEEVNGKKSLSYQFSTLDTDSGKLAEAGGGNESGGAEGSSGGGLGAFQRTAGTLLLVVLVSWSVVYWRATR